MEHQCRCVMGHGRLSLAAGRVQCLQPVLPHACAAASLRRRRCQHAAGKAESAPWEHWEGVAAVLCETLTQEQRMRIITNFELHEQLAYMPLMMAREGLAASLMRSMHVREHELHKQMGQVQAPWQQWLALQQEQQADEAPAQPSGQQLKQEPQQQAQPGGQLPRTTSIMSGSASLDGLRLQADQLAGLTQHIATVCTRHGLVLAEALTRQQLARLYCISFPWLPRSACIAEAIREAERRRGYVP